LNKSLHIVLFCPIFYTFIQIFQPMPTNRRNFLKLSTEAALLAVLAPASMTLVSGKQKPIKMNENTLKVVAVAETTIEKAGELKKVCLGLIEPTRKETGCLGYELYQDTTNPGKFIFIENWQSKELLDIHLKSPHLVAAGEAFNKILTKELVVLMLNKLA
jgi:quinol monooxygenase YgiN